MFNNLNTSSPLCKLRMQHYAGGIFCNICQTCSNRAVKCWFQFIFIAFYLCTCIADKCEPLLYFKIKKSLTCHPFNYWIVILSFWPQLKSRYFLMALIPGKGNLLVDDSFTAFHMVFSSAPFSYSIPSAITELHFKWWTSSVSSASQQRRRGNFLASFLFLSCTFSLTGGLVGGSSRFQLLLPTQSSTETGGWTFAQHPLSKPDSFVDCHLWYCSWTSRI